MTLPVSHPTSDLTGTVSRSLAGRKVVLAVTGSIAAVETVRLARELVRRGAVVQAVMSGAAQTIIHPYALQYATGREVITAITGDVEHVALCGARAEAYDLLLIAPCTANTIGKIAAGIDDTPVTTFATTAIGSRLPVIVVPAMHGSMMEHPVVRENLRKLEAIGVRLVMPVTAEGAAKFPEIAVVVLNVERALASSSLEGRKVLITSGPNVEEIDPIRVLTSRSTGRMGEELAREAFRRGADVTVVHRGRLGVPGIREVFAESARETMDAVLEELERGYDIYISAAAISDFTVKRSGKKISSAGPVALELRPTAKVIDRVRKDYPDLFVVAFKAETVGDEQLLRRAKKRLDELKADMIVANRFGGVRDAEANDVYILQPGSKAIHSSGKKSQVAADIMAAVAGRFV
ncbi:MAG TPA: bifunctional phosphopantothenoylcysteine decarboxylase/phosphopantothenate--cysteine ligase CoaBC [Methanocella sp.]|nr:bifunctional phosphopantothenoylcysteine decarboxylase/phosphopantothenate--cysteine ligase CoaBC [Methanocella sp.]